MTCRFRIGIFDQEHCCSACSIATDIRRRMFRGLPPRTCGRASAASSYRRRAWRCDALRPFAYEATCSRSPGGVRLVAAPRVSPTRNAQCSAGSMIRRGTPPAPQAPPVPRASRGDADQRSWSFASRAAATQGAGGLTTVERSASGCAPPRRGIRFGRPWVIPYPPSSGGRAAARDERGYSALLGTRSGTSWSGKRGWSGISRRVTISPPTRCRSTSSTTSSTVTLPYQTCSG